MSDVVAAATIFVPCRPDDYGPVWRAATEQLPPTGDDQHWFCIPRANGYEFRLIDHRERA